MALQEQRISLAAAADSMVGESSLAEGTLPKGKKGEIFEPLGFNIQQIPNESGSCPATNPPFVHNEFHIEDSVETAPPDIEEHQFIPNFIDRSPMHKKDNQDNNPESKNLSALRNGSDEDLCFALQLGDREPKRRRSNSSISIEEPK